MSDGQNTSESAICQGNWQRYEYGRQRGHREYCVQARRCEDFFLGGGSQWSEEDKALLAAQKRPAYEFNEVMPSVNSAIGYQIHNRMDIAFKPRGGMSDQQQAEIRSKIAMQIADDNKLHWLETQVFGDGVIQQRGYFDIRMDFADNLQGDIRITTRDPLDIIPDPDAKTYDPDGWKDVIDTSWLTLDEIEEQFGKDKRIAVENFLPDERDFGDGGEDEPRNKFGNTNSGQAWDAFYSDGSVRRARVIGRQRWCYTMTKVGVWPETGDVCIIENEKPEDIAAMQAKGMIVSKRMQRRVKWTVSTYNVLLHDDWSPYEHFTIVPYFAYFRRGKTRGMVDNAIGPQEALNKGVSQFVHIINTSANSGWTVEEGSLTNMKTEDLEAKGAMTGLVLEFKQGSTEPKKIQPNQVPTGVDRLIDRATQALKDVTVPEAMRGVNGPEVAGIAIQAKQFASQQQLATPLDNLSHTRHLLADRMLKLMKGFYTAARVFRITEVDVATGKPQTREIAINQYDPTTDTYVNDMTEGEYDVVITEQPMAATFEDSQFQQGLEMRKAGIAIPDSAIIRHSNLADKQDILGRMQSSTEKTDPLVEAQVRKIDAEIASIQAKDKLTAAQAVKTGTDSAFSSMQAAQVVATVPQVAPIADAIMQAAGYVPPNPAGVDPNFPTPNTAAAAAAPPGGVPPVTKADVTGGIPGDTTPNTPATAGTGARHGIETQVSDSVQGMANGGTVVTDAFGFPLTQDQSRDPFDPFRVGISDHPLSEFKRRTYQEDAIQYGRVRFSDGGLIQGPGTGTSDSIPAVNTDSGEPLAVSNGEYKLSPKTVQGIARDLGPDFLNHLIAQYHTPVKGQDPIYHADAPFDTPLGMQTGTVIVPADVVAAVGVDLLDAWEREYGGAPAEAATPA